MDDIPAQSDPNAPVIPPPVTTSSTAPVPQVPTSMNMKPSIAASSSSMWDAFEHILLFISLYVMAMSIALVLHYFADKWSPGIPTHPEYSSVTNSFQDTMFRGYLAALIVSTPLFSLFFLLVSKRTFANPGIKNLRSRKILIYLTLIITFLIMLSNIIVLVFDFLNGNVTLNFVIHFLITGLVSGIVFYYYLLQILSDRK